jgi:hypothetical protein
MSITARVQLKSVQVTFDGSQQQVKRLRTRTAKVEHSQAARTAKSHKTIRGMRAADEMPDHFMRLAEVARKGESRVIRARMQADQRKAHREAKRALRRGLV